MKKIFLIIAIFISFIGFAQQKELTVSDAVLSYSKGLTPKNLNSLQRVKGTNNDIYLDNESYNIEGATGKKMTTIKLKDLQI